MQRNLPSFQRGLNSWKQLSSSHWLFTLLFLFLGTFSAQAQLSVSFDVVEPCLGLPTGMITALPDGGVEPYEYLWSTNPAQTTQIISNLPAGTYSVTVTDANGASVNGSVTIEYDLLSVELDVEGCDGSYTISATVFDGEGPFWYDWSTGEEGPSITVGSGHYCITLTDNNKCAIVECVTIEDVPLGLEVKGRDVTCAGGEDGELNVVVTGGLPPYSYLWSNGETTQIIRDLSPGTYTVTVTDARGCSASAEGTVANQPPIILDLTGKDIACNGDSDGLVMVDASGGTAPYTYLWSNNVTTNMQVGLPAGTYDVTVTDADGCFVEGSITLTEPPLLSLSLSPVDVICAGEETGDITSLVAGGNTPYQYLWSNGSTSAHLNGVGAGTYSLTVTDANACTATASATINEPPALNLQMSATPTSCFDASDGSASASVSGGTAPYSYLWSNNATTSNIDLLSAGIYSVTITDAKGCIAEGEAVIGKPTELVIVLTPTDVVCEGEDNGSIINTVTGGTGSYTYQWSNNSTSVDLTNIGPGTYSVTVTDENGCTATASTTINEPVALGVTMISTDITCFDLANGTAGAAATGGTTPYSYLWSNGETTSLIASLGAGTYRVTVTDASGCTGEGEVTIVEPARIVVNLNPTDVACNGEETGSVSSTVTGGTGAYTYLWSNGSTNADLTGVGAGTYSVTVTDENSCTSTASATVNEPLALNRVMNSTDITCFGLANGAASVLASGGTPPYSYNWSNGQTTASINSLTAGTYRVTVTDAQACIAEGEVTIAEPTQIAVTLNPTDVACNGEETGSISSTVTGGTGAYSYLWSDGSTNANLTGVGAGTYSVTVTDENGCTATATATISQSSSLSLVMSSTDITCFDLSNGTTGVVASGGTPPYSYNWSNGQTTASITSLDAGTYRVTVTDAQGCTAEDEVTITEPGRIVVSLSKTDVACNGEETGSVGSTVVGGTGAYTYLWSNGSTDANLTGVGAGTYSVSVTDENGCTASASVTVNEPTALNAVTSSTDITCFDLSNGTASVVASGGTPPYSYTWSNGQTTASINSLDAGIYQVVVTDAQGCTVQDEVSIVEPVQIVISLNPSDVACNGEDTGSVGSTVSGGSGSYTYLWSNGSTNANLTGVGAGTYSVTVTDENGCTATASATVSQSSSLSLVMSSTDITCFDLFDGTASVVASGGTPPYSYNWSNGQTTASISSLDAGTYQVTVRDAQGCTAEDEITIAEPARIVVSLSKTDVACNGEETGSVNSTVVGGTGSYTYLWSNGSTNANLTGVGAGPYSVTVTDENGCAVTASTTINEPSALSALISSNDVACFDLANGTALVVASGGTPPYNYSWSNGQTTALITSLDAGTYRVTVTDAQGCTVEDEVIIAEPALMVVTLRPTDIACNGEDTGSVASTVSGGNGSYTYLWSNGSTNADLTGIGAGTYSVTVIDGNGCTATASTTVNQSSSLGLAMSSTNISCFGFANGTAGVVASGGTPPYSYLWSNGQTTASINALDKGTYQITVTDTEGCNAVEEVTITEPDELTITVTGQNLLCNGDNDGVVQVAISGGTPDYQILWSNGSTDAIQNSLTGGTYQVTVTDANGCTVSDATTISEPAPLTTSASIVNGVCDGASSGAVSANADGGVAPYTYSWSNGGTGASIDGLSAGTYEVTVTDANRCEATATIRLDAFESPSCEIISIIDVSDFDNPNGSAEVEAAGGTGPYTYLWSDGQTTAKAENLATGTYTVTITDQNGCTTTCEATVKGLAGLGDYVWQDFNRNGMQDDTEMGISGVEVKLKDAAGNVIETTTTDADGKYAFVGLAPGTYSVMFVKPTGFEFTPVNAGSDDAVDSDADPDMNGMTQTVTLAEGEFNPTLDAGFGEAPRSEFLDICNCLNNATNEENGQFLETVKILSYPGETWTLMSVVNMFTSDSPEPPATPVLLAEGTVLDEIVPGEYQIKFRVVDDMFFTGIFTNGVDVVTLRNICVYPTINANIPDDGLCIIDEPLVLDASPTVPGTVTFTYNGEVITEIDPEEFGLGTYEIQVNFIPDDAEECEAVALETLIIHENCLAMVGDYVWLDTDRDGIQDSGEPGIPGVEVIITSSDGTFNETTFTDVNGFYKFTVPLGRYKITFVKPDGLTPTSKDAGGDNELDSDADPVTGMTDFFNLLPGADPTEMVMDFTWDAGFHSPCENITDPGEVGYDQMLCGPGVDPDPLVSIRDASGGQGVLEYLWMSSTESGPFDPNIWSPIDDSNSPSYDPGPIYETTYFARCARREDCITFFETEVIEIKVGEDAVAEVGGPTSACKGETMTYTSEAHGNGADISWELERINNIIATGTGPEFSYTFGSTGIYYLNLYVTENGCTSSARFKVYVTTNPNTCGTGFQINATAMNDQQEIKVEWLMPPDVLDRNFTIEYATDGLKFEPLLEMKEPSYIANNMEYYEFFHATPKKGWNHYRVRIDDGWGDSMYSNIADVVIYSDSKLMLAYPNPVRDELIIELFDDFNAEVTIEVFNMNGVRMQEIEIDGDAKRQIIDFSRFPAGAYFIRMRYGGADLKVVRVLKK